MCDDGIMNMSSALQGPNNLLDENSDASSNYQDEMFLKVFGVSSAEVVLDETFFKVFGVSSTVVVLDEKFYKVFGVSSTVVILEEKFVNVFGESSVESIVAHRGSHTCDVVALWYSLLRRCRMVVQFAWYSLLRRRRIVVQFAEAFSHCGTACCGSSLLVVIESCSRGGG